MQRKTTMTRYACMSGKAAWSVGTTHLPVGEWHWLVVDQIVRAITTFGCLQGSGAKVRRSVRKLDWNYASASAGPPRHSLRNYIAHLVLAPLAACSAPTQSPLPEQHSRRVTTPSFTHFQAQPACWVVQRSQVEAHPFCFLWRNDVRGHSVTQTSTTRYPAATRVPPPSPQLEGCHPSLHCKMYTYCERM